jgi:hypothetical protein
VIIVKAKLQETDPVYYQQRKVLKNKVCLVEHIVAGNISADFELKNGHRILALPFSYPILVGF